MSQRLAITGGTVVTPEAAITNGIVLCEDGRISFVSSASEAAPDENSQIIDATGCVVMPGLIDTHFHGSGGDDVMANGAAGIGRIARNLLQFGTTGFLATTIAARHAELLRAIDDVKEAELALNKAPAAHLLGLHIEGPYINVKYKGAQPVEGIRDPNFDECAELLAAAENRIKIMTLAPELPGGLELIKWLKARGVIASLGHSECDYDTALAAIEAGATRATHLFNAMSGLHHRKPGLAAAALNEPAICAELICDGVHLHPQVVRHAWRSKGRDGITLVTDATAAQGMGDGEYTLGSFQVKVRGNLCTLMDGQTIAGSVLTMNRALSNAHAFAGLDWLDLAHTASLAPAQACGIANRKGTLEAGKDADVAIFKPDFTVTHTVIAGQVAYAA
ncbi:MAG: N-acetylglucosamine-6-phosphate deacetylase [Acidobacteria bacterium]|nr:N-acetylglucosamine-6-phosphate deacetylase [Acidobacteriota bacterium]